MNFNVLIKLIVAVSMLPQSNLIPKVHIIYSKLYCNLRESPLVPSLMTRKLGKFKQQSRYHNIISSNNSTCSCTSLGASS